METRICNHCNTELPIQKFTHKRKNRTSFTSKDCFKCRSSKQRLRRGIKPRETPYFNEELNSLARTCSICKTTKTIDNFLLKKGGLYETRCFPCRDEYLKNWFQKNIERIRDRKKNRIKNLSPEQKEILKGKEAEYAKKWYLTKGREYRKKYSAQPRMVAYRKQWCLENIDRVRENAKKGYKNNKEQCRERGTKRRALKLSCEIIVPYKKADIVKRDGEKCYLCGKTPKVIHLDHILPISRGGSDKPENIKIACKKCNLSKQNKFLTEFKKWRGDYQRFQV